MRQAKQRGFPAAASVNFAVLAAVVVAAARGSPPGGCWLFVLLPATSTSCGLRAGRHSAHRPFSSFIARREPSKRSRRGSKQHAPAMVLLSQENFQRLRDRAVHISAGILRAYSPEAGRELPSRRREADAAAAACVRVCSLIAPCRTNNAKCTSSTLSQAPSSRRLDHDPRKDAPILRPLSLLDLEFMVRADNVAATK